MIKSQKDLVYIRVCALSQYLLSLSLFQLRLTQLKQLLAEMAGRANIKSEYLARFLATFQKNYVRHIIA